MRLAGQKIFLIVITIVDTFSIQITHYIEKATFYSNHVNNNRMTSFFLPVFFAGKEIPTEQEQEPKMKTKTKTTNRSFIIISVLIL